MDNLDKLIEAIEHPERFSESELLELLSDPETNQLYRLMCASRTEAFIPDKSTDDLEADRQWNLFKMKRRKKSFFSWIYNRKIAAVLAVLIASCSIIMVGVSLSNRYIWNSDKKEIEQTAGNPTLPSEVAQQDLPLNDTVIVFEDEKLDKILAVIAPYYNVKVDVNDPASKEVRLFLKWESTITLPELIDHLNSFDRINLFLKDDVITDY